MEANIEVLENGMLKISVDEETRDELNDIVNDRDEATILCDLIESYSCNGSFTYIDPEQTFVGLTNAPCIAEEVDYKEDGKIEIVGNLWFYNDYMIYNIIERLIEQGEVLLHKA